MAQKLIIIRGNSGSGKTTVAKKLQHIMGHGTMLIPQDVIRRDILRVHDKTNNPAVELVSIMGLYGRKIGYNVIIEGIFTKQKYGDMLKQLINKFENKVYVYYFDIPFEETLRRHQSKPNSTEYGEEEMRTWWVEKDYLGLSGEKLIDTKMPEDEVVQMIIDDIR